MATARDLIGRDAEFAVGLSVLRSALAERASVLVIEGEAGIGKTRLVESLVAAAREQVATICVGRGHPFDQNRPFGIVQTALDLERRSQDPRRAAIGRLLSPPASTADAPFGGIHYQVVEEVVEFVEWSCARRPLLLVAEDIHWADSASLLAIWTAIRRLPLSALGVVVTTRPAPQSADVARFLDDLRAGGARTLSLAPLRPEDVLALATEVLGSPPGPALRALLDKAGGNPLWVRGLLRSLADADALTRSDGIVEARSVELPASLGELVVRRLRQLHSSTRQLLEVAAVLGDTVSLRDVAVVTRRPATEVVSGFGEAFDAAFLDEVDGRIVFRHQLVHDAIYQHLPESSRRLLHREAAFALIQAGAERLAVAHHLVLGAEVGDEQAVKWLREAALEALPRAPEVAAELLRAARALVPDGHPASDALSMELIGALMAAGEVVEASARAESALIRPHDAASDTPIRLSLVAALALQNRTEELLDVVAEGLDRRLAPGAPERVPLLAQESWARTYGGDPGGGESAAREGLRVAEAIGEPPLVVWALTALSIALGRQGRFEEALDHARSAAAVADERGVRAPPLRPKLFLGLALYDCDLVTEARSAYRAALDDEFGSSWWQSETLMADAQACFAVGEWDDAVPRLMAGAQAAREKKHSLLVSQSVACRAIIATAAGDLATARRLVGELGDPLGEGGPVYNAGLVAAAVAGVKAADGDASGAFEILLGCWRAETAQGDRFYHRLLAPDLIRSALRGGRREVAAEVVDALESDMRLAPGVSSVRAAALRCRGMLDDDIQPALDAVALARGTPLLIDLAGACEDAGLLLGRAGRVRDADEMLAEALGLYQRIGADAWATRVRTTMRALGLRPRPHHAIRRPQTGWESLTTTERAVSRLVAEGLTNGAVARQLYISPHTVNTHLRHVFTKLGVSNRVAVAAVVHHAAD